MKTVVPTERCKRTVQSATCVSNCHTAKDYRELGSKPRMVVRSCNAAILVAVDTCPSCQEPRVHSCNPAVSGSISRKMSSGGTLYCWDRPLVDTRNAQLLPCPAVTCGDYIVLSLKTSADYALFNNYHNLLFRPPSHPAHLSSSTS